MLLYDYFTTNLLNVANITLIKSLHKKIVSKKVCNSMQSLDKLILIILHFLTAFTVNVLLNDTGKT